MKIRYSYSKYFDRWDWQWFATLTFKHRVGKDVVINQLKLWNRLLCKSESIQVAYIAVLNDTNWTPHLHVLMLSKSRSGKTLVDVATEKWETLWVEMGEGRRGINGLATIELVRSNLAVSQYLAQNMIFWNSEQYELVIVNQKLLAKTERTERDRRGYEVASEHAVATAA